VLIDRALRSGARASAVRFTRRRSPRRARLATAPLFSQSDPLDELLSRSDILDGQLLMEEKALQIVAEEISTKKEARLLETRLAEAKRAPLNDAADAVIRAASQLPDEWRSARGLEVERGKIDAECTWTETSAAAWVSRAQDCIDNAAEGAEEAEKANAAAAASDEAAAVVRDDLVASLARLRTVRAEEQFVAAAARAANVESLCASKELAMSLEDKKELSAVLAAQRDELASLSALAEEEERALAAASDRVRQLEERSAALATSETEQLLATINLRTTNLESEVLVKRLQSHTAALRDQTRSLADYAVAEANARTALESGIVATRSATVDPTALRASAEQVGRIEQETLQARTQRYQAIREAENQALRALVGRALIEQDEQWNARAREMINQTNEELARVETDISSERQRKAEADAEAEAVRANLAVIDLAVAERLKELEWLRPGLINAVTSQQQRPSPTSPQKFDQTKLAVQLASKLVMEKTRGAGASSGSMSSLSAMGQAGSVRPPYPSATPSYPTSSSPAPSTPTPNVRVNRKGSVFIS
jgi:hypothetical protein